MMNDKGYEINMRGNVGRMDSPTNVANPFDMKPGWLFDHDILTMMWIARCPMCKKNFPLGRTPGESYNLHREFEEGKIGFACVDNGEYHWKTVPNDRCSINRIDLTPEAAERFHKEMT